MNRSDAVLRDGSSAPRIREPVRDDRLYRSNRIRVMLAITIGYGLIYIAGSALGVVKKPLIDQGIFTPPNSARSGRRCSTPMRSASSPTVSSLTHAEYPALPRGRSC